MSVVQDHATSERTRSRASAAPDRTGPAQRTASARDALVDVQAHAGNSATVALLEAAQPKLLVGGADDPHERHADEVAHRVVQALRGRGDAPGERISPVATPPTPVVRRSTPARSAGGSDGRVGREGGVADLGTQQAIARLRAGGAPLPDRTRQDLEAAFGADLRSVRVHDGPEARRLNTVLGSHAFALGNDIAFGRGAYEPDTPQGQELLAHELAHVVQQRETGTPLVQRGWGDRLKSAVGLGSGKKGGGAGAPAAKGQAPQPPPPAGAQQDAKKEQLRTEGGRLKAPTRAQRKARGPEPMMTAEEFREMSTVDREATRTLVAVPAKRGSTIKEIERKLEEYDALRPVVDGQRLRLTESKKIDQALSLVYHVHDDCLLWLTDHLVDQGVQALRRGAVEYLWEQTSVDRGELELARAQVDKMRKRHGGEALPKFVPERNAFIDKRAGNVSSILERIGTAIGLAIPSPGDEVEVEMSVEVPCDSYGVSFVGMTFAASATRADYTTTNISFEAKVTGGAKVAELVTIKGALGVFMEAQGATPEQAMRLISWGWYRQLRESKVVPAELANLMWGGATSRKGARRAEQWAANVERDAFGDVDLGDGEGPQAGTGRKDGKALSSGVGSSATTNAYVRTGFSAGVSAEAGLRDLADISGETTARIGKHYDQKSVSRGRGGKVGEFQEPSLKRGQTTNLADGVFTISTSVGVSGLLEGSIEVALELMTREYKEGKGPEGYVSVSGSLSVPFPGNAALVPFLVKGLKKALLPKMEEGVLKINRRVERDPKMSALGGGLQAAEAALSDDLGGALATGLADLGGVGLDIAKTSMTLNVAAGYQIGANWKNAWTLEANLRSGGGIAIPAGVASFSLSRSSRMLRLVIARDKKDGIEVDLD